MSTPGLFPGLGNFNLVSFGLGWSEFLDALVEVAFDLEVSTSVLRDLEVDTELERDLEVDTEMSTDQEV